MTWDELVERVDDIVEEWHKSHDPRPLHEFLGMTKSEYEEWLKAAALPAERGK